MSDPTDRPTVLSIVGKGRSGTTLLDLILGSLPGFFSLGEIWRWESFHLFDENRCGCGSPLGRCEVWGPAIERIESESPHGGRIWQKVMEWERAVARWRRVPRLLSPRSGPSSDWRPLRRLTEHASLLYRAAAEESGAGVLVDSSNWPANPVALGLVPGVDVVVVHLVRDPRAVAFSWKREKDLADGRGQMPRRSAAGSALSWTARNLLAEVVRRRAAPRAVVVRYEDFVREPLDAAATVAGLVGRGDVDTSCIRGRTVRLSRNHTVAGNPVRFQSGETELRLDAEWQREQSVADRLQVTALTFPLMLRYGYPLSVG